jgi:hypothetical protein
MLHAPMLQAPMLLCVLLLPAQAVRKNSKLLVMCAVGGTLDTNVTYRRDKKLFAGMLRAEMRPKVCGHVC